MEDEEREDEGDSDPESDPKEGSDGNGRENCTFPEEDTAWEEVKMMSS